MSASEVAHLIVSTEISTNEIRRAVIQLSKPLRSSLFSPESSEHRSASGKFFEALIYEHLLAKAETNETITHIVAKLNDAEYQEFNRFTRDGIWYSKDGELLFRISGKIVAETDFIVLCSDNTLVFGEVTIHPNNIFELLKEAENKRRLLTSLCKKANLPYTVTFVIVTAEELPPFILKPEDAYCCIPQGHTFWKRVHINEVLHKKRSPIPSTKRIDGLKLFQ